MEQVKKIQHDMDFLIIQKKELKENIASLKLKKVKKLMDIYPTVWKGKVSMHSRWGSGMEYVGDICGIYSSEENLKNAFQKEYQNDGTYVLDSISKKSKDISDKDLLNIDVEIKGIKTLYDNWTF